MQELSRSALYDTYLSRREDLVRFLAARTADRAVAEDLVQELYLRLERVDLSAGVENPVAYLYRMASNLALDHRRGQERARRRDLEWVDANSSRLGTETVDEAVPPDETLHARGRLARLIQAVEELTPHCRRVFVLHKLKGHSHAEVARMLGISRSTVEKHMTTALKRLLVLRDEDGKK